ncbi:MAG: hypothetical protein ACI4EI_08860 [Muricoprocola sp.]
MSEKMLEEIAENADMIIAGYAFTKDEDGYIRILNLENPDEACVLQDDGTMIETTMNDISVLKVQSYYLKNKEFVEMSNA